MILSFSILAKPFLPAILKFRRHLSEKLMNSLRYFKDIPCILEEKGYNNNDYYILDGGI
jgi:hypothetical protein